MCTLSYYPINSSSYILTHNRDELKQRSIALAPKYKEVNNQKVLCPIDPDGGGTWIATSFNYSVAILNGAFDRYRHSPPYSRSRGLVLLELFEYESISSFAENIELKGVAPFTMILIAHEQSLELTELRWDGTQKHISSKDPKIAHIWSAATLYLPEVRKQREINFNEKIKNKDRTAAQLIQFHMFGETGNLKDDLVIETTWAKTVSISQIRREGVIEFWYKDLMNDREETCRFLEE